MFVIGKGVNEARRTQVGRIANNDQRHHAIRIVIEEILQGGPFDGDLPGLSTAGDGKLTQLAGDPSVDGVAARPCCLVPTPNAGRPPSSRRAIRPSGRKR